jgi:hypothetical protein
MNKVCNLTRTNYCSQFVAVGKLAIIKKNARKAKNSSGYRIKDMSFRIKDRDFSDYSL